MIEKKIVYFFDVINEEKFNVHTASEISIRRK